ncbi:MGH1-like glycoside hydrolase domain-containing protein [Pedobacter sp. AW1-32]|uniref:MGH1-like glycoside hydrolase domain-containing protein n=1 Tax=Pedobacter sp. AW1-32 TaxID=3383026 RepID=UPI003FF06E94
MQFIIIFLVLSILIDKLKPFINQKSYMINISITKLNFGFFLLCFIVFTSCAGRKNQAYTTELNRLQENARQQFSGQIDEFNAYKNRPEPDGPFNGSNNKSFLLNNVPLFSTSDHQINKVYNYRWWMMSKHLKEYEDPYDNKKYWVVTEFFGVKPWGSLSGAITCPAGQQFYDVRWLRDDKFLKSYADYFMRGSASKLQQRENGNFLTYLSRPESHHFSSWMIDGIDAFLKVHPDRKWTQKMLPYMEKHQQVWDSLFTVHIPTAKTAGMYKILDLYDGMEFSLSAVMGLINSSGAYSLYTENNWKKYYLGWETTGNAAASAQAKEYEKAFRKGYPDFYLVRPSVNSYAYGNLQALSDLYHLEPDGKQKSETYAKRAKAVQLKTLNVLWNSEDHFFNTYSAGDNEYGAKDFEARVRESVGFTPWYFNMVPINEYQKYESAWAMFASEKGFRNNAGMTTAERQHPYYNEKAYAWNGRGWPFENSVVYKGYANYLRNYKKNSSKAEKDLLYQYIDQLAKLHGAQPNIGEWYIPSNGKTFGGESDYFHSTFPDIIIEDLLGFKAIHENGFSVAPLLPEDKWDYFYLGNLRYHNHDIDLIWKKDWDTEKPGLQSKLCIWVDGKLIAHTAKLNDKIHVNF